MKSNVFNKSKRKSIKNEKQKSNEKNFLKAKVRESQMRNLEVIQP
jgi:hypothetical protein